MRHWAVIARHADVITVAPLRRREEVDRGQGYLTAKFGHRGDIDGIKSRRHRLWPPVWRRGCSHSPAPPRAAAARTARRVDLLSVGPGNPLLPAGRDHFEFHVVISLIGL